MSGSDKARELLARADANRVDACPMSPLEKWIRSWLDNRTNIGDIARLHTPVSGRLDTCPECLRFWPCPTAKLLGHDQRTK